MDSSVPDQSSLKPINYSPSKRPLVIISLLLFFLIIAVGIIITLLFTQNNEFKASSTAPTPVITQPNEESTASSSSEISDEVYSYIAYEKNNNIWLVRSDGTQMRQITRDGDGNQIRYPSFQIFDPSIVVYTRCDTDAGTCTVMKRDVSTSTESELFSIPTLISKYQQSDSTGQWYSYITQGLDGSSKLIMGVDGEEKEIVQFAPGLGRGGSLDDQVSLEFSPNGDKLLVVNTSTQPNLENNTTTLWIIDKRGNIVDTVSDEFASNALWDDNNTIVYKNNSALVYKKTIGSSPVLVGEINGYDFDISDDGSTLLYWVNNGDGTTAVNTYSLDDGFIKEVSKNMGYTKWLGPNRIVGLKTDPETGTESYLGFSIDGLTTYNTVNQELLILDSDPLVFHFTVSL